MPAAIFLDRDGVIIENRADYIRSWEDVKIYPQALEALAKLRNSQYKVFIVTNQSPIGRGIITAEKVHEINQRLLVEIRSAGGDIDEIYLCPHDPDAGCDCRKPKPGLLFQAANDYKIDLENSVLIGDALTDLQAGLDAGLKRVAMVRTGRGAEQELTPAAAKMVPFVTYDTLQQAIDELILKKENAPE